MAVRRSKMASGGARLGVAAVDLACRAALAEQVRLAQAPDAARLQVLVLAEHTVHVRVGLAQEGEGEVRRGAAVATSTLALARRVARRDVYYLQPSNVCICNFICKIGNKRANTDFRRQLRSVFPTLFQTSK